MINTKDLTKLNITKTFIKTHKIHIKMHAEIKIKDEIKKTI